MLASSQARLLSCSKIRVNSCVRKSKNWPLIPIDRFDVPLKWWTGVRRSISHRGDDVRQTGNKTERMRGSYDHRLPPNSFSHVTTALALACFACRSQAVVAPEIGSLTNLDKRITGQPMAALAPKRAAALNKVRARIPDIQIDFDDIVVSPKWIRSQKGFLSRPLDRGAP
jgi:hypothetical protein